MSVYNVAGRPGRDARIGSQDVADDEDSGKVTGQRKTMIAREASGLNFPSVMSDISEDGWSL